MSKVDDILAVIAAQGSVRVPALDEIRFAVCVDDADGAAEFEPGEIFLECSKDAEREVGMAREFGGQWRRSWKWGGQFETFATLEQAQDAARRVKP